jgi:ribosomal protein S26
VCLLLGTDWVFMCFVWIWKQTAIISLYSINWLDFITETECVYCTVQTGPLCVLCESENKQRLFPYTALTDWLFNWGVCLLRGTDWFYVNFVWIWEQTEIISLYSIFWMVFISETECVYCAVHTGYLYVLCGSENKQRLFPNTALTEWFLSQTLCV